MSTKYSDSIRGEIRQLIRQFRLMDDEFMRVCFHNNVEGVQLVLRIILDKPDLQVRSVTAQKTLKSLRGRGVRLDISARDSENREYDIEIQRNSGGARPKRARYHSSLMDAEALTEGDDFEQLPESYVLFITEQDVFKGGRPLYQFERRLDTGQLLGDGAHIVYVNGAQREGQTALARLMHDFFCTNPDEMYFAALAKVTRYFKEDDQGVQEMSGIVEALIERVQRESWHEGREEGRNEGREEGRNEGIALGVRSSQEDVASRMLQDGRFSVEEVARYSGLHPEEVRALAEKGQA